MRIFDIEDFYQLLMNKDWQALVKYIHTFRKEIPASTALQHAAGIFEEEFLKQAALNDDSGIRDGLDLLFALHKSKHYILNKENYKRLIIEFVKRKTGLEAYNYSKEFPEEPELAKLITDYESVNNNSLSRRENPPTIPEAHWLEIYNRLFEIINQQDTPCYFTGDRFIKAVKKVQPYHADYVQYIYLRNEAGKSTTRKHFFYNIYMDFNIHDRRRLIDEILYAVRPFSAQQVLAIEMLLGIKEMEPEVVTETVVQKTVTAKIIVFISYAWDNEAHKKWVLELATKLKEDQIEVILDQWALRAGSNLPFFAEQSIKNATKVLIIYSPGYKLKADNRSGGAGYEYSILNNALYHNQTHNDKIIPVLRLGDREKSIPDFMAQYIHIDFTENENFENSYQGLLWEIRDEPLIKY